MSKVKYLRHTGLLGFLGGWLIIFLAISRNSWFVFTENAFSDLGNPAANDPWIFNYGMMLNGLLVLLYGLYLVYVSFNKRGSVGGAFMMITGVFLILIGCFPEGTRHHTFVSYWFFIQGDLSILVWGLALIQERRWRRESWVFLLLSTLGPLGAVLIPWPSIAAVETYGILLMNTWVIIMRHITPEFPITD